MTLKALLKGVTYRATGDPAAVEITGVTCDSRQVRRGALFLAVKGHDADGAAYVADAVGAGAPAVVVAEGTSVPAGVCAVSVRDVRAACPLIAANWYRRPSRLLKVTGITGTNGKTTATYILEHIIRSAGREPGVIGTINYRFKGRAIPAVNTTPGPVELQGVLAEMVGAGVDHAVMEVSSHSLDQGRVDAVGFDVAVFTNITAEHLDYHLTMARYLEAKTKLFGHLKPGGIAILNNDDIRVAALSGSVPGEVITYGIRNAADVRAKEIRLSLDGSSCIITTPQVSFEAKTQLVGMHNISNILAAAAAALALGININAIRRGIERVAAVPGRLEPVEGGQPFRVLVDYAHTEDALANILRLLQDVKERRIITVFGCGGNRDTKKRPAMGRVACELSDRVIITSDNPRFEEPDDIIAEIERGVAGRFTNYEIEPDRRRAIERALALAGAGDVVVIAGKGHEASQMVKGRAVRFDDREVVREIIGARKADACA